MFGNNRSILRNVSKAGNAKGRWRVRRSPPQLDGLSVRSIHDRYEDRRYDGLYVVDNYFRDRHASDGFIRWRYELRKVPASAIMVLRDEPDRPENLRPTLRMTRTGTPKLRLRIRPALPRIGFWSATALDVPGSRPPWPV